MIQFLKKIIGNYLYKQANTNETGNVIALSQKSIVVVFGSGGHTTEMLMMLGSDGKVFDKYRHLYFVMGASDGWSLNKIKDYVKTTMGRDLMELVC